MRTVRLISGLLILCLLGVGACSHKTEITENSESGEDVRTSEEMINHESAKTADVIKADDEVNLKPADGVGISDEAKAHDDIKTQNTSELDEEVRLLLYKDYDGFVAEYCRNSMKCQSKDGSVDEKKLDFCMTIEARNDKRNAEDPIPECPNYYMISRTLTLKCENEMSQKYGMQACLNYRWDHRDFNKQYQKEFRDCVFSHAFFKPYYSCYCANIEKIHAERDEKFIAGAKDSCREQGFRAD